VGFVLAEVIYLLRELQDTLNWFTF
jgi:hypothetical protein